MDNKFNPLLRRKQDTQQMSGSFREFVSDVTSQGHHSGGMGQRVGKGRMIDEQNKMIDKQNLRK